MTIRVKNEAIDKIDELILVIAERQANKIKEIDKDFYLDKRRVEELEVLADLIRSRALI